MLYGSSPASCSTTAAEAATRGDGERVFCHALKGSTLDHKRYADTFRAALVRAGIDGYVRPFHDGNHSAMTTTPQRATPGLAGMRCAGHSDFRVTQQYLDLAGVEFSGGGGTGGRSVFDPCRGATRVCVMSPLAEPAGLINLIRLAALKDINGGERVQEWLDSHYPDRAVIALLADYVAGKWGTLDQAWWTERFGLGDLSAEELAAELESATDKSVSPKDIGEIADEIASRIVAAYGTKVLGRASGKS